MGRHAASPEQLLVQYGGVALQAIATPARIKPMGKEVAYDE